MRFLDACTEMPFGIGCIKISRRCGGECGIPVEPFWTICPVNHYNRTNVHTHTDTMLKTPCRFTNANGIQWILFCSSLDMWTKVPFLLLYLQLLMSQSTSLVFLVNVCLALNTWKTACKSRFLPFLSFLDRVLLCFLEKKVPFPIWVRCLKPPRILIYFYFSPWTWGQTFVLLWILNRDE